MSEGSRRYTDREVALVLKRATEIDEQEGSEGAGGLSLDELRSVAAEVGISGAAIERAVASLNRGRPVGPALFGAPAVRKAVHAVPGGLDEEGIARLIRIVDERADGAGSVSEALGSVRWTSSDRLKSTRVSVTSASDQTTIEVVEKAASRLPRILHLIPAAWGAMFGATLIDILALSPLGATAAVALSVVAGAGAGRFVWGMMSAASERRVRRLADQLADEAARSATTLQRESAE